MMVLVHSTLGSLGKAYAIHPILHILRQLVRVAGFQRWVLVSLHLPPVKLPYVGDESSLLKPLLDCRIKRHVPAVLNRTIT